jgi:pimeloyl-ACP methyl ester carboxylesterase
MKKDLILLHGALGSAKEFEKVKHILSPDFNVYTLDFNGHGLNSEFTNFYIDGFSDDLKDFVTQNGLDQPFVFGFSMGGYVALYTEYREHGTFSSIVTLGTKFDWNPTTIEREAKYLDPKLVLKRSPDFAEYLSEIHGDVAWEENMQRTADLMLKLGKDAMLDKSVLETIALPIVIGRGDMDKMVSEEESQFVADALPNGEYKELVSTKHPMYAVDPERLASFIRKSFKR